MSTYAFRIISATILSKSSKFKIFVTLILLNLRNQKSVYQFGVLTSFKALFEILYFKLV